MGNHLKSQRGNSLVTVIVAMAMISALSISIASVMNDRNQQIKVIQQKSEVLDIKSDLLFYLQDPTICGCNLNPSKSTVTATATVPTFNGNTQDGTAVLALGTLGFRNSCITGATTILDPSKATSSGLNVETIQVKNLFPTDSTNLIWNGRLQVIWNQTADANKMILQKIDMPIQLTLDSTSAVTARKVQSCTMLPPIATVAPTNPCPTNWISIGSGRGSFCIEKNVHSGNPPSAFNTCATLSTLGNGPAHLCEVGEWKAACFSGQVPGMPVAGGELSDSDPGAAGGAQSSFKSTSCTNDPGAAASTATVSFRCCLN